MTSEQYVRLYEPGDENDIVPFLIEGFQGWPKFDLRCEPIDHWKWKYLDNPEKKRVIVLCFNKDDQLIGTYHTLNRRTKLGKQIVPSSTGTDVVVHKDFRGQGVNTKMRLFRNEIREKEKLFFSFGGTSNQILIESAKKRGNKLFPHVSTNMYRIKNLDEFMNNRELENKWIKKIGLGVLQKINKYSNNGSRKTSNYTKYQITTVKEFDPTKITEFWNDIKDHYSFIREQTAAHLNWRYCDYRGGEFVVLDAEEGNRLRGYIVLRINRYDESNPEGLIADLLCHPDHRKVAELLLDEANTYFNSMHVNSIKCQIIKNHPYRKALRKHGFIDSRQALYIDIPAVSEEANLGDDLEQLLNSPPNKVHLTLGEFDWI